MRKALSACLGTLALMALGSCGGGGYSPPPGAYGPLTFRATTDKQTYQSGEAVTLSLTITNSGSSSVSLACVTSPLGYSVRQQGRLIDTWYLGGGVQVNYYWDIPAGGSQTFSIPWDQHDLNFAQVPPGDYQLVAWPNVGIIDGVEVGPDYEHTIGSKPVMITIR